MQSDDDEESDSELVDIVNDKDSSKFSKNIQRLKDLGFYIKDNVEYVVEEIRKYSEPTPEKDKETAYSEKKGIPKYFGFVYD